MQYLSRRGSLRKNNGDVGCSFISRLIDVTQAGASANKSLINRVVCEHVATIQDLFRPLLAEAKVKVDPDDFMAP